MQGFLLVNKPSSITSFGVCAKLKRLTGEKRIGHTGTLDPMATGVLGVFFGRATTLSSFLLDADKQYTARVRLGVFTDTLDITGKVLNTAQVKVSEEKLKEVLNSFLGEQMQTPPAFSALKKDGVPLYKLARQGKEVEPTQRKINILKIDLLSGIDQNNEFVISVLCSKGTYIRSLCRDIGNALGCFATLSGLERTKTGGFCIDECVSLDDLTEENVFSFIKSADTALPHLRSLTVTPKQAVRFSNGGFLDLGRIKEPLNDDGEILKVFCEERFLGLGYVNKAEESLCVKCVIEQYNV